MVYCFFMVAVWADGGVSFSNFVKVVVKRAMSKTKLRNDSCRVPRDGVYCKVGLD